MREVFSPDLWCTGHFTQILAQVLPQQKWLDYAKMALTTGILWQLIEKREVKKLFYQRNHNIFSIKGEFKTVCTVIYQKLR